MWGSGCENAWQEVVVKQAERFLLRPGVFFNQLQWSSSHWMIMLTFLAIAAIETHVGPYSELYMNASEFIQAKWQVGQTLAVAMVTATKLSVMLAASWVLAMFIWMVGTLIGKRRSRKVLFRRLSVVFTVLLVGLTASHLVSMHESLHYVSMAMYAWGAILAFFAIREQFILNALETLVIASLSILLSVTSLHLSKQFSAPANDYLVKQTQIAQKAGIAKKVPGVKLRMKK